MELTKLRALGANTTRWSSTFVMLQRYLDIKEFITQLDIPGIETLMLSPAEDKKIENLCVKLSELDSVTKALQSNTIPFYKVHILFDSIIQEYPELSEKLSPEARIVLNLEFESALVKLQSGRSDDLSTCEKFAARILLKPESGEVEVESDNDTGLSFADRVLQKARLDSLNKCKYIDTRFLLPTSNICERLFSKTGCTLTDNRKFILPANLEQQIFLNVHSDLWNVRELNLF